MIYKRYISWMQYLLHDNFQCTQKLWKTVSYFLLYAKFYRKVRIFLYIYTISMYFVVIPFSGHVPKYGDEVLLSFCNRKSLSKISFLGSYDQPSCWDQQNTHRGWNDPKLKLIERTSFEVFFFCCCWWWFFFALISKGLFWWHLRKIFF